AGEIDVVRDPASPRDRSRHGRRGRRRGDAVTGSVCGERAEREREGVELEIEAQAKKVRRTFLDVGSRRPRQWDLESGRGRGHGHGGPPKSPAARGGGAGGPRRGGPP